jgi:hypothetical protein
MGEGSDLRGLLPLVIGWGNYPATGAATRCLLHAKTLSAAYDVTDLRGV